MYYLAAKGSETGNGTGRRKFFHRLNFPVPLKSDPRLRGACAPILPYKLLVLKKKSIFYFFSNC